MWLGALILTRISADCPPELTPLWAASPATSRYTCKKIGRYYKLHDLPRYSNRWRSMAGVADEF
jgi:hypothetical protein